MIRIITDSAADFEPGELQQKNIICIPLTVVFGETEYREGENLSKVRFYELLSQMDSLPKTAQASPQCLLELFEDAVRAGDEAIYISLSSALSGTYQSAVMALQMVESDKCFVVDSRNATGGQKLLVEYAVRLREEGLSAVQIVAELEQLRERITVYAKIDSLENLYHGGRISQTVYTVGTLANIKPIIQVDNQGRVTVPAKAMGTRKAMDHVCKLVKQNPPDPQFPVYVLYTDDPEQGKVLEERLQVTGSVACATGTVQVGAAIGTHVGCRVAGIAYVRAEQ